MTKLNERIANVPERIFILVQLALGLLLAAGGGYCILRFGNAVAARRDHRRPRCGPRHLRRDALRLNPSTSGMSRWK